VNHLKTEGHLEELRNRVIFCILIFSACFVACFFLTPEIIRQIQKLAPKDSHFFQIKPGELFFAYLKTTFCVSLLVGSPLVFDQVSRFIWPALKKKERAFSLVILVLSPLLFLLGVVFAYFLGIPPVIKFLFGFGVENNLTTAQYSLGYFLDLIISLFVIFGLAFQVPVLIIALALLELISSEFLLKKFKISLFICFSLGAVLTPTQDPFNMMLLSFLLVILYLVSFLIVKVLKK